MCADLAKQGLAVPLARLRQRADFVAASKGKRVHMRAFVVQAKQSSLQDAARVGFTVTKKIGGAVERNRIRRRLKEALRVVGGLAVQPGYDYVVVARREALTDTFETLGQELRLAMKRLRGSQKPRLAATADIPHATKDRALTP